jgi:hypothetical protein
MLKIAIAATILVCLSATVDAQDEPTPPEPLIPGRYQIVFNPNMRADTFLLDTATGRVWQFVQISDLKTQPMVWMYRWRVDNDNEMAVMAMSYGKLESPSPTPPAPKPPTAIPGKRP